MDFSSKIVRTFSGAMFLLCVACTQPNTMNGEWVGKGYQVDPTGMTSDWSITMHIDADGTGKIDYPSLKCGGTLSKARGTRGMMVFHENLTYGKKTCLPDGLISVIEKEDHLFWFWITDKANTDHYYASAVLKRRVD